jgi:uncharacterized membrane protein YqjE
LRIQGTSSPSKHWHFTTTEDGPKPMATAPESQSLPELVGGLANDITKLIRGEVQLAKTEVNEKVSQATSGAAMLAAGGIIAFSGFLILLLAAVFALANVVEPWLSALIIGAVVLIVGAVVLMKGKSNLSANNLKPERTIHSVKRDVELGKAEMTR